jgi:hypothetical protein
LLGQIVEIHCIIRLNLTDFFPGISKQSGSSQSSRGSSSESSDILIAQFSSLLPQRDAVTSHEVTTNVPDVFEWTSQQITDYFRQLGFPAGLCRVFMEQVNLNGFAVRFGEEYKIAFCYFVLKQPYLFVHVHPNTTTILGIFVYEIHLPCVSLDIFHVVHIGNH